AGSARQEALELGTLLLARRRGGLGGAAALAREERDRRGGARKEQDGERDGHGTGDPGTHIRGGATRKRSHRKVHGRAGNYVQSNDRGIRHETEWAEGFQNEEGRVAEIQHDAEGDRRQREQITGNIVAQGPRPKLGADQQQHRASEPDRAKDGDSNANARTE